MNSEREHLFLENVLPTQNILIAGIYNSPDIDYRYTIQEFSDLLDSFSVRYAHVYFYVK